MYYIPGRGPQGGEHRGRDKVIALWNRQKELMGGQPYHAEFQDSVATDKHVFGYVHVRAGIKGTEKATTWSSVNVYRIRDGQIAEARPHVHDMRSTNSGRLWRRERGLPRLGNARGRDALRCESRGGARVLATDRSSELQELFVERGFHLLNRLQLQVRARTLQLRVGLLSQPQPLGDLSLRQSLPSAQ